MVAAQPVDPGAAARDAESAAGPRLQQHGVVESPELMQAVAESGRVIGVLRPIGGIVASRGVIHVPVTFDRYGMRGSLS